MTNDQRIKVIELLTEQIAELKAELERKRAELRAHLVELEA